MTVEEFLEFFKNIPAIANKFNLLNDVGLGYLHLGQLAKHYQAEKHKESNWLLNYPKRTQAILCISLMNPLHDCIFQT